MTHVLTMIGAGDAGRLSPKLVADLRGSLIAAKCDVADPEWLSENHACDLALMPFGPADALMEQLGRLAEGADTDIAIQPEKDRRKSLLVADMDSTIITVECIDELADFAGLKAEIATITDRAMRGELNFQSALKERVAKLRGLPVDALEATWRQRIRLTPGARTLVRTMRHHGAYTALISGGFTYFTGRVRQMAGFDTDHANRLIIKDEKLAGRVGEPILDRQSKLAYLRELAGARGLQMGQTLAVGDGANDAAMVAAAGLGVAYHAKPALADVADARIAHADLTGLLYLQGYRQSAFVAD